MDSTEIARCYGNSCNAKAIRNQFNRVVKPDVKLILDALEAGNDPEKIMLKGIAKIGGDNCEAQAAIPHIYHFLFFTDRAFIDLDLETAKCFGGGLKGHALSMHFARNIKPNSVLIRRALDHGEDPLETVSVTEKGQKLCLYSFAHDTFSFRSSNSY